MPTVFSGITTLHFFIFTLSLLSFLISILFSPLNDSSLNNSIKNQTLTLNSTVINTQFDAIRKRNYIVRFVEYKKSEDHKAYLNENLRLKRWQWIDRRNPAAKFPTDFGLISIDDDDDDDVGGGESVRRREMIEELERLELVKDVYVDMSYERSLLGNMKRRERMGAFVDGRKRPGKIFTSMSFSDGESFVAAATTANANISWSRHLLSQTRSTIL